MTTGISTRICETHGVWSTNPDATCEDCQTDELEALKRAFEAMGRTAERDKAELQRQLEAAHDGENAAIKACGDVSTERDRYRQALEALKRENEDLQSDYVAAAESELLAWTIARRYKEALERIASADPDWVSGTGCIDLACDALEVQE